ncbi:hypothetical protein [Rubellimicrobium arenae]|nr:hypothetical protein [Rubellimicrobium arenae]
MMISLGLGAAPVGIAQSPPARMVAVIAPSTLIRPASVIKTG